VFVCLVTAIAGTCIHANTHDWHCSITDHDDNHSHVQCCAFCSNECRATMGTRFCCYNDTMRNPISCISLHDDATLHPLQVTSPSHVDAVISSSPVPALSTSYRLAGRAQPDGSCSPRLGTQPVHTTTQ
jgi:hypothetical protein